MSTLYAISSDDKRLPHVLPPEVSIEPSGVLAIRWPPMTASERVVIRALELDGVRFELSGAYDLRPGDTFTPEIRADVGLPRLPAKPVHIAVTVG